jgi:hypothetical protein
MANRFGSRPKAMKSSSSTAGEVWGIERRSELIRSALIQFEKW